MPTSRDKFSNFAQQIRCIMKWNTLLYTLLFSGFGTFSFLLLINYTDLPESVICMLNSVSGWFFFLVAFNLLGYITLRISTWMNNQYALNLQRRWKILLAYAAVMLLLLLLNYGVLVSAKILVGADYPFIFPNGGIRILVIVWLVELVILGLLLANRSIQNMLILQQQAADLQRENNTARYTALQSQLNPHFLFNSLNTLIAEIEYNPSNAIDFTKNLSDVYRYVLQCQDKSLVPLRDELDFMQSYLFLHEVRLGNCIHWNADIPSVWMDSLLPPLTLQLLVENVIKHNSITSSKPMEVSIRVEDGFLVVSNLIRPKKSRQSSGIGLTNLSNRCKLMLGKALVILNQDGIFTVKVPLSDE